MSVAAFRHYVLMRRHITAQWRAFGVSLIIKRGNFAASPRPRRRCPDALSLPPRGPYDAADVLFRMTKIADDFKLFQDFRRLKMTT